MHTLAAAFSSAATWLRAHKGVVLGVLVIGAIMTASTVDAIGMVETSTSSPTATGTSNTASTPGSATQSSDRSTLDALLDGTLIIVMLANLLNHLSSAVASLTVTLIDAILVPILRYNGFATSQIVDTGWSLVRDTVNMFVVVILLVIAVLTIVGSSKANWQQQIPRLFLFTIAVNFSRTICGIFIDISNVVMFQFVNAIVAVGAGNMAQLLMLPFFGDYSEIAATTGPIEAWQHFGGAYLQLALMLAVLGVILIMTLVYLYRIVVLWILIIMSPLAFFAGGIKDIVGAAGGVYGDWTKRFTSALFLGPVLTFFLWLALSVSSSGTIIDKENFPTGDGTTSFGLILKVFEMSNITSLLLGLVLLVVGMQQAGRFAGDLGGFAGQWINEGMGMNLVKRALKLPGGAGYLAGREVARQADRRVGGWMDSLPGGKHRGSVAAYMGDAMMASGEWVNNKIPGGSVLRRPFTEVGDRVMRLGEAGVHHAQEHAEKRVKEWSDDRKKSEFRIAAKQLKEGTTPLMNVNADARNVNLMELATKLSLQKDIEGEKGGIETVRWAIKNTEDHKDHVLTDQAKKDAFKGTKSRYADQLAKFNAKTGAVEDTSEITKYIADPNSGFNPNVLRKEALEHEGADKALSDAVVQGLKDRVVKRKDNGETVSAYDEMLSGSYGPALKAALTRYGRAKIDNTKPDKPSPFVAPQPIPQKDIEANMNAGTIDPKKLTPSDINSPSGDNLTRAFLKTKQSLSNVTESTAAALLDRAHDMTTREELAPDLASGIQYVNLETGRRTAREVFTDPQNQSWRLDRIAASVENNIRVVRHLADALHGARGKEVADVIVNETSQATLQGLEREYRSSDTDAATKRQLQEVMTQLIEAVAVRELARPDAPSQEDMKLYRQMARSAAGMNVPPGRLAGI